MDAEIPWFSWSSIEFLQSYVNPEATVFEYGSGGSTLFFSRRAKSVVSVEDNHAWHALMTKTLAERGVQNAELMLASADLGTANYRDTPYVRALDRPFDIIIIDGTEDWPSELVRPHCFNHAETKVTAGG
ncbi:hypothetical protein [Phenylobacterium sp. J367]|uniref:hypothetical protein n=1 Tax=Phenylobacterium sp. J367 TaxID=2898435 RepID=UPI002151F5FC|nr:hypothetical protein [Phenylobacterium sp. J367]MCR5879502.1 hypothetical protein [Phenylobacterium sp. J367]